MDPKMNIYYTASETGKRELVHPKWHAKPMTAQEWSTHGYDVAKFPECFDVVKDGATVRADRFNGLVKTDNSLWKPFEIRAVESMLKALSHKSTLTESYGPCGSGYESSLVMVNGETSISIRHHGVNTTLSIYNDGNAKITMPTDEFFAMMARTMLRLKTISESK